MNDHKRWVRKIFSFLTSNMEINIETRRGHGFGFCRLKRYSQPITVDLVDFSQISTNSTFISRF